MLFCWTFNNNNNDDNNNIFLRISINLAYKNDVMAAENSALPIFAILFWN